MKAALQYIVVFGGSLLIVVALAAAAFLAKPDIFNPVVHPGQGQQAKIDSAARPPGARFDRPTLADLMGIDSLVLVRHEVQQLRDSLRTLELALEGEKQKAGRAATPQPVVAGEHPDTPGVAVPQDPARATERKSMAKVLESMQAENAARILKDLSDSEVKEILLVVKKRQAAKILAALEPDRAARIMR